MRWLKDNIIRTYNVNDFEFVGFDLVEVLADKLNVTLSGKLPRRIKDLYDIYFITTNYDFTASDIAYRLDTKYNISDRIKEPLGFLLNIEDCRQAYKRFRGIPGNTDFQTTLDKVIEFITPILTIIYTHGRKEYYWKKGHDGQRYWSETKGEDIV